MMAAYATTSDVEDRMLTQLTDRQDRVCSRLLEDVAVLIDAWAPNAQEEQKRVVSCSVVIRALGSAGEAGIPAGATQGSVSALGYSQSWTISNGSAGELYLTRAEKKMLGIGNSIGSHSPLEETEETE